MLRSYQLGIRGIRIREGEATFHRLPRKYLFLSSSFQMCTLYGICLRTLASDKASKASVDTKMSRAKAHMLSCRFRQSMPLLLGDLPHLSSHDKGIHYRKRLRGISRTTARTAAVGLYGSCFRFPARVPSRVRHSTCREWSPPTSLRVHLRRCRGIDLPPVARLVARLVGYSDCGE